MGRIKLGNQDDKPDFTRSSWPEKLIGWSADRLDFTVPLNPLVIMPSVLRQETGTANAIKDALTYTFFHWGLHDGIYDS